MSVGLSTRNLPFGEVFDLEIPESGGSSPIPAAYIEEVLAFGTILSVKR